MLVMSKRLILRIEYHSKTAVVEKNNLVIANIIIFKLVSSVVLLIHDKVL